LLQFDYFLKIQPVFQIPKFLKVTLKGIVTRIGVDLVVVRDIRNRRRQSQDSLLEDPIKVPTNWFSLKTHERVLIFQRVEPLPLEEGLCEEDQLFTRKAGVFIESTEGPFELKVIFENDLKFVIAGLNSVFGYKRLEN
jgi:hypothetical protein